MKENPALDDNPDLERYGPSYGESIKPAIITPAPEQVRYTPSHKVEPSRQDDQPVIGVVEKPEESPPENLEVKAKVKVYRQNVQSQKIWGEFVEIAGKETNQSLLSLLRSCIMLELDQEKLVIGTRNLKVFDQDKQDQIQRVAWNFFNPSMQLEFHEAGGSDQDSINVQEKNEQEKQIEARKEAAKVDPEVLELKQIFKGSNITSVTLIEEDEDV